MAIRTEPTPIPEQEAENQDLIPPQTEEPSLNQLVSEPEGAEADPEAIVPSEGLFRLNDGANLGVPDEFGFVTDPVTGLNVLPEDIPVEELEGYVTEFTPDGPRVLSTAEIDAAAREQAALDRARQQQTIAAQRKQVANGDWRVRLRLAPQADYLYMAPRPGILYPLRQTDGVIFPYTPTIQTAYRANYTPYDLTHSNYRGYWYQNSYVEAINLNARFTAQDTAEAEYVLAVIHFFRSVTKMFYGNDMQRGSPPPLTYLTGLGEYQFNEHPCVVSQFNYTLPSDIDYIRAGVSTNVGLNQNNQKSRQDSTVVGTLASAAVRLLSAGLTKGALTGPPGPNNLQTASPTYVPTKIDIQLTLLPIQSRNQISQQFSVKEFANGNLLKGGFW